MRNLLYIAGLVLALASCEKDPIEDVMVPPTMTTEPTPPKTDETTDTTTTNTSSNTTTGVSSETTVETGTTTDTGVDTTPKPGDEEPSNELGEGEYIDETVVAPAGTTYLRSHFDGKDSRSHFYEVDEDVILVYVNDSPHPNEGTKHWYFGGISRVFSVDVALDFVVYRPEFITTIHRGIEIKHLANETPRLSELDRALDLAGDNWESDVIYQYDNLASIGGFAGLARNREFIVSIGGFETHVLLHENGHNYDFEHEDYMDQMTAIYPEGGFINYYTSEVAEFRAEMFARYYLYRADMPAIVRNLLDILLN